MLTLAPTAANARDELVARAAAADGVRELFRVASERLPRLLGYDACVWLGTDPATLLPTAPSRSEQMRHVCGGDPRSCLKVWELEFTVEDVNHYRDLAHARVPAGALRLATGDRPERSARYREFLAPNGFGDELRVVLRAGGHAWATLGLFREHGSAPFDADDTELAASLSLPLGEAVREHVQPVSGAGDRAAGPGLLLFAPDGELKAADEAALMWLDELPRDTHEGSSLELHLPMVVAATLVRARALAERGERGAARARVRSRAGRWLACHASCLREPDGAPGDVALVIEPANPSELAPLIAQAYGFSPREQEITELLARGLATSAIAARLYLSVHTVRDYIKAIFEKAGVSSRGELVATLFANHYAPIHLDPSQHDHV
jgi:DNA-binding CsgD family transcriptional regulator